LFGLIYFLRLNKKLAVVDDFRTFDWDYPNEVYKKAGQFLVMLE
jgi:hypothetical protein